MNNKPRILFIATFPPPVHGSAVVSQQIKESKLINEAFDGDYVNIATSRGLDEKKNYLVKMGRFIVSFAKTFWLLLTRHYDLCYCAITCHGGCFLRDAPYVLLCKLFRRKVVIHQHNKGMSRDVDRPVFRWLYPLVYNNVKVILLSWYLYPDIEKVVKRENVMICPNGIKPTADPSFVHTPNKVPHILFLSNLLIDKGVLVLLDALKILKDKGYSFICDFVGSETHDISAQRFAEEVESRGLNQMAVYHGRKYGNDKAEFFEKADVFTLPSFNEAFPLVNLEAMDYKLPIVSTNVGGVEDEVYNGENGFVVKPNDGESLAEALCKLLDDSSLRQKMGEEGYRIFKSKFTDECFEGLITKQLNNSWGGVNINLVNFWGRKYGKEKAVFWHNADMFVFPTFYSNECFPLVLLEAMEKSVSCISTEEGGIRDIIANGETGYVTPKQDAASIAEAIEKLLINTDLKSQMGNAGRKRFEELFTEEQFEITMMNCLKKSM